MDLLSFHLSLKRDIVAFAFVAGLQCGVGFPADAVWTVMTARFRLPAGRTYNVRASELARDRQHTEVVCNVLLLDNTVQAFRVNVSTALTAYQYPAYCRSISWACFPFLRLYGWSWTFKQCEVESERGSCVQAGVLVHVCTVTGNLVILASCVTLTHLHFKIQCMEHNLFVVMELFTGNGGQFCHWVECSFCSAAFWFLYFEHE